MLTITFVIFLKGCQYINPFTRSITFFQCYFSWHIFSPKKVWINTVNQLLFASLYFAIYFRYSGSLRLMFATKLSPDQSCFNNYTITNGSREKYSGTTMSLRTSQKTLAREERWFTIYKHQFHKR